MARFNNKKLQAQRNFQSIWHSHPENIGKLLKEDQLIREYIIGTMKAKEWKLSEIIIKRKVKHIHIAFQIQNKKEKERIRWTKNRLKNRIKYKLKKKRIKSRRTTIKKRYLFFQLYLMVTELRKMYPNNLITFYIQKTKPLQFNANLVSSWIIANMKKKKSYKRLLNRVIRKYKKGVEKTKPSFKTINSTWNILKKKTKKKFLTWITGNLIYLYNTHNLMKPTNIYSYQNDESSIENLPKSHNKRKYKKARFYKFWLKIKRDKRKKRRRVSKRLKNDRKYSNYKQNPIYLQNSIKNISKQGEIKSNRAFWNKLVKIKNISKQDEIKPQKNYSIKNMSKRNIHTLSPTSSGNISHEVTIPSLNLVFRRLSTKIDETESHQSFEPLAFNQIYSNFISRQKIEMTKKTSDQQNIKNSEDLKIRGSIFNKLLFCHLTKLKLAFLLSKKNSDEVGYSSSNVVRKQGTKLSSNIVTINQDLRTTWKLTRKLPRMERRLGKVRRYLWLRHRKEFYNDLSLLLDYYKYRETPSLNISLKEFTKDYNIDFIWQGKNFIKFLKYHPPLLDHIIRSLIAIPIYNSASAYSSGNNTDPLIVFLTNVWTGFFDYMSHFENSLSKWQGIKINLKGRIGFKKMGRAKKYSQSWGSCKNSSASLPLQYNYSQIHTRYGAVSMRIFIR